MKQSTEQPVCPRTAVILLFVVLSVSFSSYSAADCVYSYDADTDPQCTTRLYYKIFTVEPNWCDYQDGDVIFAELTFTPPSQYTMTRWYVVPRADTAHQYLSNSPFSVFSYGGVYECSAEYYF